MWIKGGGGGISSEIQGPRPRIRSRGFEIGSDSKSGLSLFARHPKIQRRRVAVRDGFLVAPRDGMMPLAQPQNENAVTAARGLGTGDGGIQAPVSSRIARREKGSWVQSQEGTT